MLINDDVSKYLHVMYQIFFHFLKAFMMVITCDKFQTHTISLSKKSRGGNFTPLERIRSQNVLSRIGLRNLFLFQQTSLHIVKLSQVNKRRV